MPRVKDKFTGKVGKVAQVFSKSLISNGCSRSLLPTVAISLPCCPSLSFAILRYPSLFLVWLTTGQLANWPIVTDGSYLSVSFKPKTKDMATMSHHFAKTCFDQELPYFGPIATNNTERREDICWIFCMSHGDWQIRTKVGAILNWHLHHKLLHSLS